MTSWFNVLLARADKMLVEPNVLNVPVEFVSRQIGLPRPLIFTGGLFILSVSILLSNGMSLVCVLTLISILGQASETPTVTIDGVRNNNGIRVGNWSRYSPLFVAVILVELYIAPNMSSHVFQTYWAGRNICLVWVLIALGFDHAIGTLYPSPPFHDSQQNGYKNDKKTEVGSQERRYSHICQPLSREDTEHA